MELFDILSFKYAAVEDVLDIPETYQQIVTLNETLEAGFYILGVSAVWSLLDHNDSAYFQWIVDGHFTRQFISEPSDINDVRTTSIHLPVQHAGGAFEMTLNARKEDAGAGQFDIETAVVTLWRVG